jgi:hypothetical protein
MKTIRSSILVLMMLAGFKVLGAEPEQKALKTFTTAEHTISKALHAKGDAWMLKSTTNQIIRLFEVPEPAVENCKVIYRAKLKTEDLSGPAYLEMWCRFPGLGEAFSRGLDNQVNGSNDWASYEIPFFLKKGEKPDLIKLNLVVKGSGKIWIKDIELLKGPLPDLK